MPERAETPVIRRYRPSATSLALFAACLALCALATVAATGTATGAAAGEAATAASGPPASARPVTDLVVHMTSAAQASAATRCAHWATAAGFANDGYLSGSLVTAVAVSLAESGCTPRDCFDDTRRRACTEKAMHRKDSVDRGAWQLNSKAWGSISNQCAFSGPCAARAAYLTISSDGTFFARWTQYDTDAYAHYLWPPSGPSARCAPARSPARWPGRAWATRETGAAPPPGWRTAASAAARPARRRAGAAHAARTVPVRHSDPALRRGQAGPLQPP